MRGLYCLGAARYERPPQTKSAIINNKDSRRFRTKIVASFAVQFIDSSLSAFQHRRRLMHIPLGVYANYA